MSERGRGRLPGFRMTEEHRDKIRNSNILSYLIAHAQGDREMSATQASVGLGLLRKVMPDLAVTQLQGDADNPIVVTAIERRIVDPKG